MSPSECDRVRITDRSDKNPSFALGVGLGLR